ncbi:MAG TPA: ATP-binding protein [Longimicrobiales bacterium]|nr:ATP-binding protein [Longimicrobiales bacterium]
MRAHGTVERLAALPSLEEIPRGELEWLVANGGLETHEVGEVIAPAGERIRHLWVILSGRITVRVDRGAGPRRVITWAAGDVTGMLPYSRMKAPPGDNILEEPTELLVVHEDHFPEMVHRCPAFTAYTVHLMLDRARSFNASALQDEKMVSLGRLAAGLAHELNNPASAALRSAKRLREELEAAESVARTLGSAGLDPSALAVIDGIRSARGGPAEVIAPLELADREDEILSWLERRGADPAHAGPLAEAGVTTEELERVSAVAPGPALDTALRSIAAGCSTRSLALDIEAATGRIHELVAAVKRFTYMDRLAAPRSVEVESGLRDTARVLAAKAREKGVSIEIDLDPDLPPVRAVGGELNQVWLNLLDNALDAARDAGRVRITARRALDRVVVAVIDDGEGIDSDALPRIFDPFFTTKAPGQGTGLGLEIARRLVRGSRGDISVESRPGRTEFRVELPADEPRPP